MLFQPDQKRSFLDVPPAAVVALYQSVNQTTVLVPGESNLMASAVVVGHRVAGGFEVEIGLHLVDSGRHLLYSRGEQTPLDAEGAKEAARDALAFVESIGFFMENVNWKQLSPEDRSARLSELKVFAAPPRQAQESRRTADPRTRLARLLAQL